jgi:hypothetical protein
MRSPVRPRSVPAAASATPTFVQVKYADSGSATVASQSVTLDAAATAGNLLVVAANSDATITTPSGYSLGEQAVNAAGLYLFFKIASGGETGVTCTPSVTDTIAVTMLEYSGITASSPLDVTATSNAQGVGGAGPVSAGTTATLAQAVELVVAVTGPHSFTNLSIPTSPTWTNGYTSRAAGGTGYATGAQNSALFVADLVTSGTAGQTTATSWTNSAQDWGAVIVTFKGA